MRRGNQRTIITLAGMAIAISILWLAAGTVHAQSLAWNPPCSTTKATNVGPIDVILSIATTGGTVGPTAVNAGSSTLIGISTSMGTITGVISQGTTTVPITIPGPPLPGGSTPTDGAVMGVILGPAPGSCVDVYFQKAAAPGTSCWIWIFPSHQGTCIP